MTTARILDSGKERRIAGLVPEPLVASYLTSDSAGCTIVMIGLPDPRPYRSETAARTPSLYICGTPLRVACRENLGFGRAPLRKFSPFTLTFATGARTIFGADGKSTGSKSRFWGLVQEKVYPV